MATADLGDLVDRVVERKSLELRELSRFVWEHPELALEEVQCHAWLTDFLEHRGFEVTRHYLLDTAFRAEFDAPGGSEGPCVAFLCEFDALPDIGHACGHNLIAEASVGAALAVQEAMRSRTDIRGKLVVLGTPAEESFCGKELMARKGALGGVDAALMAHPSPKDLLMAAFTATHQLTIRFKGKAAHAAATPWDGLNALDAAVSAYVNISLLRQQLEPHTRVHGVISQGGKYANIVPEETELRYFVRSPCTEGLVELLRKVEACFRAAADATGCSVEIEKGTAYMHVIHNSAIARAYGKHARALGVSFVDDFVKNLPPSGAATDCGNISHRVPTIHPVFGVGPQGRAVQGAMNHTREFAAVAYAEDSQPPTLRAAKCLALTALDLFTDAELLCQARQEFAALRLNSEAELQAMLS